MRHLIACAILLVLPGCKKVRKDDPVYRTWTIHSLVNSSGNMEVFPTAIEPFKLQMEKGSFVLVTAANNISGKSKVFRTGEIEFSNLTTTLVPEDSITIDWSYRTSAELLRATNYQLNNYDLIISVEGNSSVIFNQ